MRFCCLGNPELMFAVFLEKIDQFVVHFGEAYLAECADAVFLECFIVA